MNDPASPAQVRTRLGESSLTHERDGTCIVRVELALPDGRSGTGQGAAPDVPTGHLRAGARATLEALHALLGPRVTLEFRGAKLIRAFDTRVAIVAVGSSRGPGPRNLLGTAEVQEDDLGRSGAIAALDAVNRHLARELTGHAGDLTGG
ncbi:MAG: hypothetical protein WD960_05140 [Gemmatimonadota bacterium]